jgi:hypothetical protein
LRLRPQLVLEALVRLKLMMMRLLLRLLRLAAQLTCQS